MSSGENLKRIRKDLGLKQKDLECKGVTNISRLEKGVLEISPAIARILLDRINTLIFENNLDLKYEINEDIIMGKANITTDEIIKKIANYTDANSIMKDIDEKLLNLNNENSIIFLKEVIGCLKLKKHKNAFLISEYSYKLIQLDLNNKEDVLEANRNLIMANQILGEYQTVISLCKNMEKEVSLSLDFHLKESFYGNFSLAYLKLKRFKECEITLSKVQKFTSLEKELSFLTMKANCNVWNGKLIEGEKLNNQILDKSIKIHLYNYIINSYSNLADIYMKRENLKVATDYINKALELIDKCENNVYIYNLYFNYMSLEIKKDNSIERVKELFLKVFSLSIKINNPDLQNKAIREVIVYYKNNDKLNDFRLLILETINTFKIELTSDISIEILKVINNKNSLYDLLIS